MGPRRGATERVGHDEELHHVVVRGRARRLDDERVDAADVLADVDEALAVAESGDPALAEGGLEVLPNRRSQARIGVAGEEAHLFEHCVDLLTPTVTGGACRVAGMPHTVNVTAAPRMELSAFLIRPSRARRLLLCPGGCAFSAPSWECVAAPLVQHGRALSTRAVCAALGTGLEATRCVLRVALRLVRGAENEPCFRVARVERHRAFARADRLEKAASFEGGPSVLLLSERARPAAGAMPAATATAVVPAVGRGTRHRRSAVVGGDRRPQLVLWPA